MLDASAKTKAQIPNPISGMFNDHTLDNICYVLTTIHRSLQLLINLFPFQHRQGVMRVMEKFGYRCVINIVAFVFQPMNLYQSLRHIFWSLQLRDYCRELFRHALDHVCKLTRVVGYLLNVENNYCPARIAAKVDNIAKSGRHHVDIFTIKRGDERLVQAS